MAKEQVIFWRDDDDIYFVLDQHTKLDFYGVISLLKQHSTSRHIVSLLT
jgi:hypothetical protein